MLKRPHYIALVCVVLFALIILNLPGRATARLKLGIGSIFLPLFGLAGSAQQAVESGSNALIPRREILRQNEDLRREVERLRVQSVQLDDVLKENARLRQLFAWQKQVPWKMKLGRVVLREPSNWWRTVQIDLGSRDGITNNMPVLTTEGLIGRIGSVSLTRSQVVLLGDHDCKVAARVENESHDTGIISGSGPLNSEFVEMNYLSASANLKPGQLVRSSGNGGLFPKGIMIGTVVDSHPVEYGLAVAARVKLAANPNSLEEVWVKLE
jgi:rod shape-determining protein MreC